jgi:hypothetical protein
MKKILKLAWNLAKALDKLIDCGTIFYNPVVEYIESTYDNLSDTYDILFNINNNYSLYGTNPDNLPETYLHDLSSTLDNMYPKLQQLRSEIGNLTAGNFQVELCWLQYGLWGIQGI